MSNPFVAEIRIFPFNFAPRGWAFCNGQLLPISQNTALFSLLGTNYGGDGRTTFGLPNLQGSVAIHTTDRASSPLGTFPLGSSGGEDSLALLISEIPQHTHSVQAESSHRNTLATSPSGAVFGDPSPTLLYSQSTTPTLSPMNPSMVSVAGSSSAHNNLMPYLALNYCIAMQGVFPARN